MMSRCTLKSVFFPPDILKPSGFRLNVTTKPSIGYKTCVVSQHEGPWVSLGTPIYCYFSSVLSLSPLLHLPLSLCLHPHAALDPTRGFRTFFPFTSAASSCSCECGSCSNSSHGRRHQIGLLQEANVTHCQVLWQLICLQVPMSLCQNLNLVFIAKCVCVCVHTKNLSWC